MCTVSLLPIEGGFTLTMNRDERRNRAEGGLSRIDTTDLHYCYPIDQESNGTWLGMNNQGVALALLNRYQCPTIDNARSRGEIIPTAIRAGSGQFHDIFQHLQTLDTTLYNPFDCLLVTTEEAYLFSWNRQTYQHQSIDYSTGFMHSSSSERLEEVLQYRRALFAQWQNQSSHIDTLGDFHLRQAPDSTASDVLMSRPHTHTKSLNQIKIQHQQCQFNYYTTASLKANAALTELEPTESCRFSLQEKPAVADSLIAEAC